MIGGKIPPPKRSTQATSVGYAIYTTPNENSKKKFSDSDYQSEICQSLDWALQDCKIPNDDRVVYMTIHGYGGDEKASPNGLKTRQSLSKVDPNAVHIAVDWKEYCQSNNIVLDYPGAADNTILCGEAIAWFVYCAVSCGHFNLYNIKLIGHSLGAHCAGMAGQFYKELYPNWMYATLPCIYGLDAAGPLFEGEDPYWRLDPDDADFVQAIHTCGTGHFGIALGCNEVYGDCDYYCNGGKTQPSCGGWSSDLSGSCAHGLSCDYWIDSITNSNNYDSWELDYNTIDNDECASYQNGYYWAYFGYNCPTWMWGVFCTICN